MVAPMPNDKALPGRLDRICEFVNTLELETGADKLLDPVQAEAWLSDFGFDGPFDAEELKKLRDFREAIRVVLLANGGHGELAPAWKSLSSFGPASLALVLDDDCGVRLLPAAPRGEEAVRSDLTAIRYDAVRDGSWRRMKACRKDSCLWAYYDRSKNGSGAWCSMAVCGNRVKAQRRRSRAKT
jgi:predicted RNA-binding Zn ribbon-like protein